MSEFIEYPYIPRINNYFIGSEAHTPQVGDYIRFKRVIMPFETFDDDEYITGESIVHMEGKVARIEKITPYPSIKRGYCVPSFKVTGYSGICFPSMFGAVIEPTPEAEYQIIKDMEEQLKDYETTLKSTTNYYQLMIDNLKNEIASVIKETYGKRADYVHYDWDTIEEATEI